MSSWTIPAEYSGILPKIRVLLLGPYRGKFLKRMANLRTYFITEYNMGNCRIVADFNTPQKRNDETNGQYNLRKSLYWISHADILFYIYFDGADNAGVQRELGETFILLPDCAWRVILAYHPNVSTLVEEYHDTMREISIVPFSNIGELKRNGFGPIENLLRRFYYRVDRRLDGEWENSRVQ